MSQCGILVNQKIIEISLFSLTRLRERTNFGSCFRMFSFFTLQLTKLASLFFFLFFSLSLYLTKSLAESLFAFFSHSVFFTSSSPGVGGVKKCVHVCVGQEGRGEGRNRGRILIIKSDGLSLASQS